MAVIAYIPTPTILIEGQPQRALNDDVVSVLVEETIEGLYRCEARFSNTALRSDGPAYLYFKQDILDFGKEIAVTLGPNDNSHQLFSGLVSAIEGSFSQASENQIAVLAEDRLQKLRMARHTRTFSEMSDADAISAIASENGLSASVNLPGHTYKALMQINQSDLAFVRERARHNGAEVWVEGQTLHVSPRAEHSAGQVQLEFGDTLLSFRVRADLAQQYTEIGVTGWDVAAKEAIDEAATVSDLVDRLGGASGSSILAKAWGARAERIVHTVPTTTAAAKTIAKARFNEQARRFVTGSGLCDGNSQIRVGTTLSLSGLGGLFSGDYYVVGVRHSYDRQFGFRTAFEVERAFIGSAGN